MQVAATNSLNELLEFLRFPSISTDSVHAGDMVDCAEWLVRKLSSIGLEARLEATDGHPAVVAKNRHQPDRRTVMIYGHYDVQPVDPLELWDSPPFEPSVVDGIITARGATDNKGQIYGHILGVQAALEANGDLPVNLIFLIEGEEEIGSPHLEKFLIEHQESLQCDVVVISDTTMIAPGTPSFTYALRGIAAMECVVRGPAMDLHSGLFGGAVVNPATVAARLVASLHDQDYHVQIEKFYDDLVPVADWERDSWAKLPDMEASLLEVTKVNALGGEKGYSPTEQIWARPTAEVNGIAGGYQGEGSKTVLPKEAMFKLTFRLVPAQDPARILDLAEAHLRKHCPAGVTLEVRQGHTGRPYMTDPFSDFGLAAQRACEAAFGRNAALLREGGSIPIVQAFKEILGVDTLLLGFALPDCKAHSPNENFPVSNFEACIALNQKLMPALAEA